MSFRQFWSWVGHVSQIQWIWQLIAATGAGWVVIDSAFQEFPLALTVPAGLAVYVLILSAFKVTADVRRRYFSRDAALRELWRLRNIGISMRNRTLAGEAEYPAWKAEADAWLESVYAEANKISNTLQEHLRRLDRMEPPPRTSESVNDEHERWRHIVSEVLLRLQRFQEKELGI